MLTTLVFFPSAAALLLMLAPRDNPRLLYKLNIAIACVPLVMVLLLWPPFLSNSVLSLLESRAWIPTIGASYALRIDGINLPFLTMITFLVAIANMLPPIGDENLRKQSILLFFWETVLLGAFLSHDYVLFVMFWAASTVPIYYLMEAPSEPRELPTAKTYVFSSLLSIAALAIGLLILSASLEAPIFAVDELSDIVTTSLDPATQWWTFLAIFVGCSLRLPVFPMHIWLPLTLPRLPVAAGMVLVGGFIPLGIYGLLRFALAVLSDAIAAFTLVLAIAGVVNLIFGSLASLGTENRRRKAGYQTMAYTGIALLATATFTLGGISGALYTMIALGLAMAYSLALTVLTYPQDSPRGWPLLLYGLDAAQQLRLPGFAGFIGLLTAFSPIFRSFPKMSMSVIAALILMAIDYGRLLSEMLSTGPDDNIGAPRTSLSPLMAGAGLAASLLLFASVVLGFRPDLALQIIDPAIRQILPLLN